MSLVRLRRRSVPLSVGTLAAFLFSLSPARLAHADEAQGPPPEAVTETKPVDAPVAIPPSGNGASEGVRGPASVLAENHGAQATVESAPQPAVEPGATGGGNKSGVSSQALALPQGAGKIQGMGESFSTDLSTGVASFSIPIDLPSARGGAQPSLGLTYSSASGRGVAGLGWGAGVAFIARQTDRGLPQYLDPPMGGAWAPTQDRFVFNGGQELVPICQVSGTGCADAVASLPAGESMPAWASGWQYFRPRVEGGFLRFFWSPDHRTWRVQTKSGNTMELGAPLAEPPDFGSTVGDGLETNPADPTQIFRWNLVREYDAYGNANPAGSTAPAPSNVVYYGYETRGGMSYLSDIFDTPPAANPAGAALSTYAHHAHLVYEARPDAATSYRRGWATMDTQRLAGIDVTSEDFANSGTRQLLRRYHLGYDPSYHISLLTSVQLEGRCSQPIAEPLPATTGCPMLPATTLGYQHVVPYDTSGAPGTADLSGWEGFDERILTMANSPDHSLDETLTDLFDVNADGLPDVLVTAPWLYNGSHAVYFNGEGAGSLGVPSSFGNWVPMGVTGVAGETTNVIRLDNPNVSALDIEGDGTINLVNMPLVKTYSVYRPQFGPKGWMWQGTQVTTASDQNVNLDFTGNNPAIQVMDVNADGLVDVVFSAGTEYQTFLALGQYPNGYGQFGAARRTGASSALISNSPLTSCLPWDSTPAMLSDTDVYAADMNGDGLPDLVRVRPGDVRYWPGRGNGYWGTGDPQSCPAGTYGQGQDIVMTAAPQIGVVASTESLLVDDVNGDGFDDIVKVEFEDVLIWLNVDGTTWVGPHIIQNSPARVPSVNRMRLVDINGSGTRDILYGDGSAYRYMDLNGGERPWVLTSVQNGLGKTTDIQYGSSTQFMLADAAAGNVWSSVTPVPAHVVTQVTEHDNLGTIGRPDGVYVKQYTYHNAVYDGRQREFRGFESASETQVGDANSPTSTATSTFLLGQCVNDENLPISPCADAGRWEDNPREALKGLPLVSEISDASGDYRSTAHHAYTLAKLYTGLDGREVRYAFESQADEYRYDDGPFVAAAPPPTTTLPDVVLELTPGTTSTDVAAPTPFALRSTAPGNAHLRHTASVDAFGNATQMEDDGNVGVDSAIVAVSVPVQVSAATGWMWRTSESYVNPGRLQDTLFQYDAGGNARQTQAVLSGSLALDRFYSDGSTAPNGVAPTPASASKDGVITLSVRTYDKTLGVLTQETGPDFRCHQILYDQPFSDLPVQDTTFVGQAAAACTGMPLHTIRLWDRGLGEVTQSTDPNAETSTASYDGLGRATQVFEPDPLNIGQPSTTPSLQVQYCLPGDTGAGCAVPAGAPYAQTHVTTLDGATAGASSTAARDSWSYEDGLGRTIVVFAQAAADDGAPWIASGATTYDAKGATQRAYLPWFWTGSPGQPTAAVAVAPASAFGSQRYDAFGRALQTFALDGTVSLQHVYHALSADAWDAADLMPGPHQGTPATVTSDGHGRSVSVTERVHNGSAIEAHTTQTTYLPTGVPSVIARINHSTGASVTRWMQYDSLDRMVLNADPDSTSGFGPPGTAAASMKAWRYAYDDAGDLVGTSDARGCGENLAYDVGGRLLSEDYSPCLATQSPYTAPVANGDGTEALYVYDAIDRTAAAAPGFPASSPYLGRLSSVRDLGEHSAVAYDGRGRTIAAVKQLVTPGITAEALANRYAPHWYGRTVAYDDADRSVSESTGVDVAQLLAGGQSAVNLAYTQRGTIGSVGSSYGALVTGVTHAADGPVTEIVYGDTARTTSTFSYDMRRRLSSVQTYRGPPAIWSSPTAGYSSPTTTGTSPTAQLLLQDLDYSYDAVDNPIAIRDYRNPAEWPAGAQPVTRQIQYDDLYRATQVAYEYPSGTDPWIDPFNVEDQPGQQDPRRPIPAPHVGFGKRALAQTFQYDWLGNTTSTDDDQHGFYDRSLGQIVNGTPAQGPYQLQSATGSTGALTTQYDSAGNLASMAVARTGACLPSSAPCSQRYVYDWDEVGRLARARRWDTTTPGAATDATPTAAPNADLRYAYDADGKRTLKTAAGAAAGGKDAQTAYVFGSLELRRTTFDGTDYVLGPQAEVGYLDAAGVRLGNLHYALESEPALASGQVHVLMELPDHLGSTSIIIDHDTSELVEARSYLGYGAADSDYRPTRWASFREDYGFTGKEDDAEAGLTYFGARYMVTALGRWASPDPKAIHQLGADLNLYCYVQGRLLSATDPMGLDSPSSAGGDASSGSGDGAPQTGDETPPAIKDQGTGDIPGFHGSTDPADTQQPVPSRAAPAAAPTAVTVPSAPRGGLSPRAGTEPLFMQPQPADVTEAPDYPSVQLPPLRQQEEQTADGPPRTVTRIAPTTRQTPGEFYKEFYGINTGIQAERQDLAIDAVASVVPFLVPEEKVVEEVVSESAEWLVGPHGAMPSPRPSGFQSHHGVNSVWAETNIPGYVADDAPGVLLRNNPFHNATRAVFNKFRAEIARRQGVPIGEIDWAKVSPGSAWRLAEEQFDAAQVPEDVRAEYFRQFNEYREEPK